MGVASLIFLGNRVSQQTSYCYDFNNISTPSSTIIPESLLSTAIGICAFMKEETFFSLDDCYLRLFIIWFNVTSFKVIKYVFLVAAENFNTRLFSLT